MKWAAPAGRLMGHRIFRRLPGRTPLPLGLTVSVTHRCNLQCVTCRIAHRSTGELTASEWERVAGSFRRPVFWFTFSGGEPFLRSDLHRIVEAFYRSCRPFVINIPTNGTVPDTAERVRRMGLACRGALLVINLSLDDTGVRHDRIRGGTGVFDRAVSTFRRIRQTRPPNVRLGIHTVLSTCNIRRLPRIVSEIRKLRPDHYITEIAEERWELQNAPLEVIPSSQEYENIRPVLEEDLRRHPGQGFGRISASLRIQYYGLTERHLREKRRAIPCYAGRISAHVDADGTVWTCCVQGREMGRLQQTGYDFEALWHGSAARKARLWVDADRCACPLANAALTNMLLHPPTLLRTAGTWRSLGRRHRKGNIP